jgi:hypothetical protein
MADVDSKRRYVLAQDEGRERDLKTSYGGFLFTPL